MYQEGLGVLQDYKTALEWWTMSAEQGYVNAHYNLGVMYALAQGIIEEKFMLICVPI